MIQAWLNVMCQVLPKVRAAAVVCASNQPTSQPNNQPNSQHSGVNRLLAIWPTELKPSRDFLQIVPIRQHQPSVRFQKHADGKSMLRMAKNLSSIADQQAIVIVELEAEPGQQAAIVQLLEWGERWLELLNSGTGQSEDSHVDAIGEILCAENLNAALTAAATHLSQAYQLDRVFIGRGRPGVVKVCAVSHNVRFDSRSSLIRQVESALEEAVIAQSPITDSDPDHSAVKQLKCNQNMGPLMVMPLADAGGVSTTVMLIENESTSGFTDVQIAGFETFANLIGPAVRLREQAEQSVVGRLRWDARRLISSVIGPRFLGLKVAFSGLLILLVTLAILDSEYEVVAPATLEGRIQRAIVAPFAGYLKEQNAKAGDSVTKGQLVAELDARELELEHQRLLSARDKVEKQYRQALAILDQVDVRIYASQILQFDVQLDLIKIQIARTRLIAPMSGIIIRGDLSRSLGATVERGDVLFEIAPLDDYRLLIDVPENRITALEPGQSGYLVLKAFPDRKTSFLVEQIAGATEQTDGAITFSVIAAISDNDIGNLRPGMSGVARVNAGQRSILWIHSHEIVDWLKLTLWQLSP
jgi:multidrug resistance efflux pump